MFDIKKFKSEIDIVDYISNYLTIKKNMAVCPFHNDKNPSFTIYTGTQSYYCFGCKASGDVINFVQQYHGLHFIDAVMHLADHYKLPSPFVITFTEKLYKLHNEFLKSQKIAINWCGEVRGIPMNIVTKHQLGYTGSDLSYLTQEIQSLNMNINALANRVSIPIFHENNKLVGFTFRSIYGKDRIKYLHLKKMPKNSLFYNEHNIKNFENGSELFLVEGFFDVLRLDSINLNAIAVMGSNISDKQIDKLKNWIEKKQFNVSIMMDGDEAGQNAAKNISLNLIKKGIKHKIYYLPDKNDPDEYFIKNTDLSLLKVEEVDLKCINNNNISPENKKTSITDTILIAIACGFMRDSDSNDGKLSKRRTKDRLDKITYQIFADDQSFLECYEFLKNGGKQEINSLDAYLLLQKILPQANELLNKADKKEYNLKVLFGEVFMFYMTAMTQIQFKKIAQRLEEKKESFEEIAKELSK